MGEKISIYLKAHSLKYLILFLKLRNSSQFHLGNLFDPLPKDKKEEKTENYVKSLAPDQAVRYSRYHYTIWMIQAAPMRISRPDLSMYQKKDRELLEKLVDTTFFAEDLWRRLLQESIQRKEKEDNLS